MFFIIDITVEGDDISKYSHLDEHPEALMTVQLTFSGHSDKTYSQTPVMILIFMHVTAL